MTTLGFGIIVVAVDATNVYWTSTDASVKRIPKVGGAVDTLWKGALGERAWGIVASGSTVFWRGSDAIYRTESGGGAVSKLVANQPEPKGLAALEPFLFWSNETHIVMMNTVTKAEKVLTSLEKNTGRHPRHHSR